VAKARGMEVMIVKAQTSDWRVVSNKDL